MDHTFFDYAQYLSEEDYGNLIQYIDNLKNNINNDKMLIVSGPPKTGKTSLINAIRCYLGQNQCYDIIGCECINYPIRKVWFTTKVDEIKKEDMQFFINMIHYKQSIISETNHIENVNKRLLKNSIVINMNNVFTN